MRFVLFGILDGLNFSVCVLVWISNLQTGELRHISHLNFTAWPDHDTPSQPDDLITFISYMRHIHKSGPIITHCSAGIGRSGTLICLDVVLGLISQDLEVSKPTWNFLQSFKLEIVIHEILRGHLLYGNSGHPNSSEEFQIGEVYLNYSYNGYWISLLIYIWLITL